MLGNLIANNRKRPKPTYGKQNGTKNGTKKKMSKKTKEKNLIVNGELIATFSNIKRFVVC